MIMHGLTVIFIRIIGFLINLVSTLIGTDAPVGYATQALTYVRPYIAKAVHILQLFLPETAWNYMVTLTLAYIPAYITLSLIAKVVKMITSAK